MSVHDAEPGDIYADVNGKMWRVIGVVREPLVEVEEVEGTLDDPNAERPFTAAAVMSVGITRRIATIRKERKSGGVSGLMWSGWTRIFRRALSAQVAP